MVEINIKGITQLREDYKNPNEVRYYAVLDGCFESEKYREIKPTSKFTKIPAPKFKAEIPITKEEYNNLKEQLKNSKAESPVLRVKGKLEIILDSESYA